MAAAQSSQGPEWDVDNPLQFTVGAGAKAVERANGVIQTRNGQFSGLISGIPNTD